MDWIQQAQDRDRWRTLVNTVSIKYGEFLDQLRTGKLIKKDSSPQSSNMTGIKIFASKSAWKLSLSCICKGKGKGLPQQAEVAQGVPGRLRSQIFLTFGTTRVVGCQPYAPAAFTSREIAGTHFQRLSRPQGTWFCREEPRKKIPSDTTGNRSRDRSTSSAVP